MVREYLPKEIEEKWQKIWEENKVFENDMNKKEPYYVLEMFSYPSGSLHMGHLRNYTIGDAIARYKKMKGFNVFHPIGWDSFGLPAENAAIDNGANPKEWTIKNISQMREQLKSIGLSYNFKHELSTCMPDYYKFDQKIFIEMYKKGLVYKKLSYVNWCPDCNTVLANEQVEQGKCWRHGKTIVIQKELSQWYFKITEYADELLEGHKELEGNWPKQILTMQKNWIGKSEGAEITFMYEDYKIPVFTTRIDTLYGVSYIVLAPEHELSKRFVEKYPGLKKTVDEMINEDKISRTAEDKEKVGIFTKEYAVCPLTNKKVPIWIGNYVLLDYGTGAVMGVPGHDERDKEFAHKYKLPVIQVNDGEKLINSDKFTGLSIKEAKKVIIEEMEKLGLGFATTSYKLHDWLISRQRYWGAPIPVLYDEEGNIHLEDEENLPVLLPEDVDFSTKGNPILSSKKFIEVERNGKKFRRETDTMDTFVDSSWYFLRYLTPRDEKNFFDKEMSKKWMPVNHYIGGIEHAVMHLLYARFLYKVFRDLGYVVTDEPFKKLLSQGMVLDNSFYDEEQRKYLFRKDVYEKDGKYYSKLTNNELIVKMEKMSKSKNNGVSPNEITKEYGADSARLFTLFAAPIEKELIWKETGVVGAYRFINRIFTMVQTTKEYLLNISGEINLSKRNKNDEELQRKLHQTIKKVTESMEDDFKFNTAIASIMELLNELTTYKQKVLDEKKLSSESVKIWKEAIKTFILLISPFTPHVAEELYQEIQEDTLVYFAKWPEYIEELTKENNVNIAIQINGKLRDVLEVEIDKDEKEVLELAFMQEKIKPYIEGKEIVKKIYVKNKIVNIVVK